MNEQQSAVLMARISASRDKAAFSTLFDYYAPRIKSYLMARGAQQALAEELLQSSLLQIWEKAGLYDPNAGSVSTWIYRIARNRYFDHLRKQKLRDRPPPEEYFSLDESDGSDLSDLTDNHQQRVQAAVKQLPGRQAQVLYMSFYQGKTHSEIAAELDIPLGSVKSSLRLAFEKLRNSLGASL